jgi:hypothetical protein
MSRERDHVSQTEADSTGTIPPNDTVDTFKGPCLTCNQRLVNYICPHCKEGYCSVDCYRSRHHQKCPQDARTPAQSNLGTERKAILETLKRYGFDAPEDGGSLRFVGNEAVDDGVEHPKAEHTIENCRANLEPDAKDFENVDEEDIEDDASCTDLKVRMDGLDIENAGFDEIWERLNPEEREEFVKLAQELDERENMLSMD